MTIDMFKCPKCGEIVDEHDWTMTKIDENKPNEDEDNWGEGFICTNCNTVYSGKELDDLILNYGKSDSDDDLNYNPFDES